MTRGGPSNFLLLPSGATGSMEFDDDSILMAPRGAKKLLVGTTSGEWRCGVSAQQDFSIFLLFTRRGLTSSSAEPILFLRPLEAGSAGSLSWLEGSG